MKNRLVSLACTASFAASLALSACADRPAAPPAAASASKAVAPAAGITSGAFVAEDSGGSARGDFGPPEGAPIQAVLTDAPNVPPPTGRSAPAKVIVSLEVKEVEKEIAPGARYMFWTFGGNVPGKFIRVRQGDTVEFHLLNAPDSKMPHNIDLHAVTGPGGGAESTFTAPGHQTQFTFKALNAGLFVYHCATAPVGMHIANGMYGLILVEPPQGLPPVDREYYVMQGDFYTAGKTGAPGLQPFDLDKAVAEQPTYVLFNGKQGALTGEGALTAKTGERVRLFVGNGGPNLVSSFHVIGEIFDHVYTEGGTRFQENVQTTLVPSGGAAAVDFKVEVPGTYALVDHSIFRTFNKGALGQLNVTGPERPELYSHQQKEAQWVPGEVPENAPVPVNVQPAASQPTGALVMPAAPPSDLMSTGKNAIAAVVASSAAAAAPAGPKALSFDEQLAAGKKIFGTVCAACHMANAQGIPGGIPPLAGSDFLMKDKQRSIEIVTHGLQGPVTVNGQPFNSMMPPLTYLSDADVANVLTFVRNSFGNKGAAVSPAEVAKVRSPPQVTAPVGAASSVTGSK